MHVEHVDHVETSEPAGRHGTFLLGVGCQKGGTAWMHRYLESSAQADLGFRKEYHVWDGLDLPRGAAVRARVSQAARNAGRAIAAGEPADAHALHRAMFYADPETYFDYFASLLRRSPEVRLTADITPAYAVLSEERLRHIKDSCERRGVRCVAVFLMRDPVERIWSAVRMYQQRAGRPDPLNPDPSVLAAASLPTHVDRTRYDHTIGRLDAVFGEEVFYGFYERLFDPGTLRPLCDFLGIDHHQPDVDQHVNVSPKPDRGLSQEAVASVAGRFVEVYAAVAERFPGVDLHELWPSSRLL